MSTKDYYLSLKEDKQQNCNSWNNSVSNDPQYSNLNLNANHQNSFNGGVIQSQNISSSLNSKGKDQFSADNNHLQTRNDSITWSKNDNKKFSFLQKLKHNNLQDNENLKNQNKASTTKAINNSTLSLHIAAYENSIEASGAEAIDGGNNEKKKARNKPLKNVKQVFNESTSKYNYYFEIPRQQEGDEEDVKDPEIMHFKASQKLLDPYEGGNDNNSGGGDGVLNHPQQPQQQQQEIKHSPTSTNHHPPQQDVQQQQEQQQQYYGHPQQPYFYPTGQMAPLNLPPPPGSFLAVDENNQAIGYIIPAQQWNPQQQQYPTSSSSSSATHSIRPRFSTSSQQQMFYQVQQQPLHRQVSNSNNRQLPEYWQQRPILISMPQHLQQQHGSSRRATTSTSSTTAAGFIPIQPKPGVIPHTVSRKRYRPPSPGTDTNPPETLHQTRHQNSLSSVFPEFSIEATGAQFLGSQKRPAKKLSKDFGNATPHRISMALQANIHTEAVWALNALTVKLYDDSVNPPTLTPELLNSIVEHFWANLSLVYPKIFAFDEKLTATLSNGNDDDNDEEESECFWLKVVENAKKSGETIKTKIKLPMNHHHHHLHGKDLNSFSREGIKIISKDAEMPTKLKTWKQPSESPAVATTKKKAQGMSYEEYRKHGLPTEFSLKIAESTKQFIEHIDSIKMDKAKFSKWDDSEDKHAEYDVDVQPREQHFQAGNGNNDDTTKPLHHSSHPHLSDLSMIPSHINLFLIPKSLQSFTELCLGWSNVIRGFAFNPINQKLLVKNACLLRIIGKLLLLYVQKSDEITAGITKIESNSEKAEIRSYLLDIANQLRDDAFTILSFMTTGAIELFDMDSEISYSIFDALIHWVVTSSIFSKHSLVPWGVVSPRDFSLEILAKICITNRNVDLLLSTGPWKRIEEFVLIISEMIYLGEDTQIREFALVIMCAMCNTSEPVCFTAALKTNIIKNIVNYLENVDATIYEVISTKGMEYRDHPDYIGTTTAMLKKAITILESMAQHEVCRKSFIKYIKQLDKLTLSQFIDKELITQIASVIHMIEPAATAAAAVTNIEKFEVKTSHVPGIQLMVLEKFD